MPEEQKGQQPVREAEPGLDDLEKALNLEIEKVTLQYRNTKDLVASMDRFRSLISFVFDTTLKRPHVETVSLADEMICTVEDAKYMNFRKITCDI